MTMEIITAHEADQIIATRKPLAWPVHTTCNGNCNQGRMCDCTAAVPDADEWQPTSWRDDLAFWGTVGAGTAAFGLILALALGWRL